MVNNPEDAKYLEIPSLSPYLKQSIFDTPKEDHKFFVKLLKERIDVDQSLSVVDVGCASGALLHLLLQRFPHWTLTGYDFAPEFIESAKGYTELTGVEFLTADLFDIDRQFDLVLSCSVFHSFTDIEKAIGKALSICNDGGHLFITGLFNKYDIDVRLQFCDNSNDVSKGIWRADWNQHSQQSIIRMFDSRVTSIEFIDIIMDKDLPLNSEMPINQSTFRDSNGRNIITNGVNMILNKTMMVIKK